jgi:hypothetical protein
VKTSEELKGKCIQGGLSENWRNKTIIEPREGLWKAQVYM